MISKLFNLMNNDLMIKRSICHNLAMKDGMNDQMFFSGI